MSLQSPHTTTTHHRPTETLLSCFSAPLLLPPSPFSDYIDLLTIVISSSFPFYGDQSPRYRSWEVRGWSGLHSSEPGPGNCSWGPEDCSSEPEPGRGNWGLLGLRSCWRMAGVEVEVCEDGSQLSSCLSSVSPGPGWDSSPPPWHSGPLWSQCQQDCRHHRRLQVNIIIININLL